VRSRPSSAASFPLPSMAALSKLISDAMASSDVTDVVSAQPYPLIPSMRGDFLTSSLTPHHVINVPFTHTFGFLVAPHGHCVVLSFTVEVSDEEKKQLYYHTRKCMMLWNLVTKTMENLDASFVHGEPIHSVAFNPALNKHPELLISYGKMPRPHTLLLEAWSFEHVYDLGTAARNTIVWAPNGKYFLIGGFGNLQGNWDIWQRNGMTIVNSGNTLASFNHSFSPESHTWMCCTTFDQMKVDNQFLIYRTNGELCYKETFDALYMCKMFPCTPGIFPSVALPSYLLKRVKKQKKLAKEEQKKKVKMEKKLLKSGEKSGSSIGSLDSSGGGVYIPPSLRRQGIMRRPNPMGMSSPSTGGAIKKPQAAMGGHVEPEKYYVPGLGMVEKAAGEGETKKKRNRKKKGGKK
ncbi:Translation initiation factor 2A like protein, partial [Aduncisulcus paluster]